MAPGPRIRPDLDAVAVYRPGDRSAAVDAEVDWLVKLSSNEWPAPPFPEVHDAIVAAISDLNRYPDNSASRLREAIARRHDVEPDNVLLGAGSNTLLAAAALLVGGPGTTTVYAEPSFALYPGATRIAGGSPIEVPLDAEWRHDLAAMAKSLRNDTTLVYICNPNNPTGTAVSRAALEGFVHDVPEDVLVAVDEAYIEFADPEATASMVDVAATRGNVMVFRTFSKVFGLAGLRLGYVVTAPAVVEAMRKVVLPFSANSLAQVAATEALRHPGRLAERVAANAAERARMLAALSDRGIEHAETQANFVWMAAPDDWGPALQRRGVITRRYRDGYLRVSFGAPEENDRFISELDVVRAAG